MGANYKAAGFDTVKEFATTMMSEDEDKHLGAFVNFVMSNDKLLKALQDGDWAAFAEIYNGPDYKDNNYDTKLKTAFEDYKKQQAEIDKEVQKAKEFWVNESKRLEKIMSEHIKF